VFSNTVELLSGKEKPINNGKAKKKIANVLRKFPCQFLFPTLPMYKKLQSQKNELLNISHFFLMPY